MKLNFKIMSCFFLFVVVFFVWYLNDFEDQIYIYENDLHNQNFNKTENVNNINYFNDNLFKNNNIYSINEYEKKNKIKKVYMVYNKDPVVIK